MLTFVLRVMPHRGVERTVLGTWQGDRGKSGPISRVNVADERWLIESGLRPEAWFLANGSTGPVPAALGQAVAGTNVTVFDLQMPFLYWTDFYYEGQAKVRGRPTHSFILRPPSGSQLPQPGFTGVRVLIDAQFQAMVQAEQLGVADAVEKTIILLDLKKVGEQWLMKSIDVRNTKTRDKTRLTVTSAALGLHFPSGVFTPEALGAPPPLVPQDNIVRF